MGHPIVLISNFRWHLCVCVVPYLVVIANCHHQVHCLINVLDNVVIVTVQYISYL